MMRACPYFYRPLALAVLMMLGGFSAWETLLWAAFASTKPGPKPPATQPRMSERKVLPVSPKVSANPPVKAQPNKSAVAGAQGHASSGPAHRKSPRHRKAGKKWHRPAVVEPKPDLSYHGMFEQPQRYDPSRDRQTGRAPNPQGGELQHDHFQELDKNRDGMIDPFERAFGRLDMDRDVSNRQWE